MIKAKLLVLSPVLIWIFVIPLVSAMLVEWGWSRIQGKKFSFNEMISIWILLFALKLIIRF